MTNEEAVRILRRIQEPEAWEPQINGAAFEALDMAIEALGIKPCDYTKACMEVSMGKVTSAYYYLDDLEELKKHGYVLVDMREVAIKALDENEYNGKPIRQWIDAIAEQPEIIRCRDCRHRDEHGCCKHWKALSLSVIPIATDDDDFCSYAERKNVTE